MAGYSIPAQFKRVGRTWNQIVTGLGLSSHLQHCLDVGDPASASSSNTSNLVDVISGITWFADPAAGGFIQMHGTPGQMGEEFMAFQADFLEATSNSSFFNTLHQPGATWTLMFYGHYQTYYGGSGEMPLFGTCFTGQGIQWQVYEFSGASQHMWDLTISTSIGGFFFDSGNSGQGPPKDADGGIYPAIQWYGLVMDQTNKLVTYHTATESVSIACDLTGASTLPADTAACWFATSDGFAGTRTTQLAASLGFDIALTRAQFMSIVAGSVASSSFTTRGAFP